MADIQASGLAELATGTPLEGSPSTHAVDAASTQATSARAFDDLIAEYREMSDSERMKGNLFEQLSRQYLLTDAQMRQAFEEVYLWRDWPGNEGRPDTGIDLVGVLRDPEGNEGGVVAIQCKFFGPGHRIQKRDIDSFLSESGKHGFVGRIIVETTGEEWSHNALNAIEDQQIPVQTIGLTDFRNSDIDWSTYTLKKPEAKPELLERKELRDHQVSAIRDVFKGFETHDRGTLVMACGTGKTFTALKIAERFAEERGDDARVLFMVPSLALMSQTLGEWAAECELPFHAWSVCSDTKVNRKRAKQSDLADISVTDLKIPPTTEPQKLADSLARYADEGGLQVVFATYQSVDVIIKAQELGGSTWRDFDVIICDEAHRTTGVTLVDDENESAFVKVHDNTLVRAEKRLYMTATPRLFNDKVKNVAKEKDAVLTSMDDEDIYGPVFHRLGFGEAVSLGLLTDYKVVILGVPEEEIAVKIAAIDKDGYELNLPDMAKLAGVWNALAKRKGDLLEASYGEDKSPMRRAVAFAKDIKTSQRVAQEFQSLVRDHLQNLINDDVSDNLGVEVRHVDGDMNAIVRGESLDWLKEEFDSPEPVCRILSNARCLSEGVDVPTLDSVIFLNPRKSQVDVIQAVGRVMRKAPNKEFGYVILPVVIPFGQTPEEALNDNERYKVIWQVLQAIRAHDERFDATVNSIEYNTSDPTSIVVDIVQFTPRKPTEVPVGGCGGDPTDEEGTDSGSGGSTESGSNTPKQQKFNFEPVDWKDAVYSKIVKKVGNRLYWDDWSKDIADIASRYISLINRLLDDPAHKDVFNRFVKALQQILNPSINASQAVEMLAQHIITKPLFDAMFDDQQFTSKNPVSRAMQAVLDALGDNQIFVKEREPLEKFYSTMVSRIREIDNITGKQQIMVTLYDKFFSKAFPAMADRLGIVFTPVPVVDYILHSANDALKEHFGKTLGDTGVELLEPFLGTGTFVSRLLASGIIKPEQLEHKYKHEIFANEIVLLSYYIASINIEAVYRQIRIEQGYPDEYVEFEGISLTDTFQLTEGEGMLPGAGFDFAENVERLQRQRKAKIRVIVMNPPYSAGQGSANDNNQNLKYPTLDERIERTYVTRSSGTNKNSLYDSYFRALRWATDRIGDEGVIAFVSNNSFLDGNTADGVRLTFQDEFADIYIYNLKGNARTQGERRRREGGGVFGEGARTGVTIAILVKRPDYSGPARIHYAAVDDYLKRQEKLDVITTAHSVSKTDFQDIVPNKHGDWINQRDESFIAFQPIGEKSSNGRQTSPTLFQIYSSGLKTNRDAWCYNFSNRSVKSNMSRMIDIYNSEVNKGNNSSNTTTDASKISWNRQLFKDLDSKKQHNFSKSRMYISAYRPFTQMYSYFDRSMNDMVYQLPQLIPTPHHPGLTLTVSLSLGKPFAPLMTDLLPDLHLNGDAQCFPLFTWKKLFTDPDEVSLFELDIDNKDDQKTFTSKHQKWDFSQPLEGQVPTQIGGYERQDNITDATLLAYQAHYSNEPNPLQKDMSKEDIFFYVYALLHHPAYRERYEADLKKMLPRIPQVPGFWSYAEIGRKLADLHVNYEDVEPYPIEEIWSENAPTDEWERCRVEKMKWAKKGDPTRLVYNQYLTFAGIPEQINDYQIGGRSPLEWMIDRYKVSVDKKSQILNDPNEYFREVNNPRYLVDLIKSLVTVTMRTLDLIDALPEFVIEEN